MKESDMFQYLVDYFNTNSTSEIFTEVDRIYGCGHGGRPDIVVRNRGLITIVEMKTSLSLKVIEQAYNWRYQANYVYIAVPATNKCRNNFLLKILDEFGIGLLEVDVLDEETLNYHLKKRNITRAHYVSRAAFPQAMLFRNTCVDWKRSLKERYKYNKNIPGGSKGKGYNTEYKEMMDNVRWYLQNHDEVTINELIENVEALSEHYHNPKQGLYNAVKNYGNTGITLEYMDGITYLKLESD